MKRIVIFQENASPIILFDKETEISEFSIYGVGLSEIMKSKEISILETSSGIAILKPSKILGIKISEVQEETTDMITDGV